MGDPKCEGRDVVVRQRLMDLYFPAPLTTRCLLITAWLLAPTVLLNCGSKGGAVAGAASRGADSPPANVEQQPLAPACDPVEDAPTLLPGVEPAHLTLDYWLAQLADQYALDEVLLAPEAIDSLNASLQLPRDGYEPLLNLLAPADLRLLVDKVNDRRVWARENLESSTYVNAQGEPIDAAVLASLDTDVDVAGISPELRVVISRAQLHCAPLALSFFSPSLDLRLDRNACSTLQPQEVVRLIAEWPNGMKLVQASYSFGWLGADAVLSPKVPRGLQGAMTRGATLVVQHKSLVVGRGEGALTLEPGTRLAAADSRGQRAHVATAKGFVKTSKKQAALLQPTRRGLTRRALLSEAWRHIGSAYGLGGTAGGRDCSRLLMDTFSTFDVRLPRHSSWQAQAGSFSIDIEGLPEAERPLVIDAAAQKGVVLLYFPGHIMLYLGRNEQGVPMVLHALGEYLEPCGEGRSGEKLLRVKNVTVSTLEPGRGTSRKAFIERITRVVVIGKGPGPELSGIAQLRPAGEPTIPSGSRCRDSPEAAIYVMPEQPSAEQPLRVVTVMDRDPGPAELTLIDPQGRLIKPEVVKLGGPPFGQVATVQHPQQGKWQAVFADGDNTVACQRIRVRKRRPKPNKPDEGPVWLPKWQWSTANENLYSLFVERLFDYPSTDDRVWSNLHTLLRDPDRNLLFDYRGLDEDAAIELSPDCADLPYTLRAYFAWKIRLPFGFRRCTRARAGKPPNCNKIERRGGNLIDNLMSRMELKDGKGEPQPRDDVEAFELFINRTMRYVVHSSSGRTLPDDDLTDFYPVKLTREALKPGTLFADPYGHLLVVADWKPQGLTEYGMLVGVDAQPDGTVGRRRFWRGSFLFDPDTASGGAGFKAFRPRKMVKEPIVVESTTGFVVEPDIAVDGSVVLPSEPESGSVAAAEASADAPEPGPESAGVPQGEDPAAEGEPQTIERLGFLEDLENDKLRRSRVFNRYSDEQYRRSADDFYATVEALINPRPLEPTAMQKSLVDALAEGVARRVTSVDNGEQWVVEHPGEIMEMPEGAKIFLSAGPWEDYSTPSRDLRLLISIDSVMAFPEQVKAAPARFGIQPQALSQRLSAIRAVLSAELLRRTFNYRMSDGSLQTLSLSDLVQRAERLEMAYNPNDCVELRWGAAPGSAEMQTCRRHAPDDQRARMAEVRPWFSTRKRPPQ